MEPETGCVGKGEREPCGGGALWAGTQGKSRNTQRQAREEFRAGKQHMQRVLCAGFDSLRVSRKLALLGSQVQEWGQQR